MERIMETGRWFIENDVAYACSVRPSALVGVDILGKKISLLTRFSNETDVNLLFDGCVKYKNKVFCIPSFSSDHIGVYDLIENLYKKIEFDCVRQIADGMKIFSYKIIDDVLYMNSYSSNAILGLNLETEQFEFRFEAPEDLQLSKYMFTKDGFLYVLCVESNVVIKVCLKTNAISTVSINDSGEKLGLMLFDDTQILFAGREKKLYIYNDFDDSCNELVFPNDFKFKEYKSPNAGYIFSEAISLNGECWLIPYRSGQLLYVNTSDMIARSFDLLKMIPDLETKNENTWGIDYRLLYIRDNRYLGLYLMLEGRVIEVDTINKSANRMDYSLDQSIFSMYKGITMSENNEFERQIFWDSILK